MIITDIWCYPVKSLGGHSLGEADLGSDGIDGDRAWSLVDVESGLNLTARRQPELLYASARVVDDDVVITTADGAELGDDDALSAWLERDVRLQKAGDSTVGTYETQRDETETGQWFQWEGPSGSFHDSTRTKVSLVSEATLGSWDRRRFRINVILGPEPGEGTTPGVEDGLVERTVTLGEAEVQIMKRIDRCVMVTRPQPSANGHPALERDLDVLRTLNAERNKCLGIGALVTTPGRIAVGDRLLWR